MWRVETRTVNEIESKMERGGGKEGGEEGRINLEVITPVYVFCFCFCIWFLTNWEEIDDR